MFCKILLDNKDICKEIVELLLGCRIKEIVYPEAQKTIEMTSEDKDILLNDESTKVIINANGSRDNLTAAQIAFLD